MHTCSLLFVECKHMFIEDARAHAHTHARACSCRTRTHMLMRMCTWAQGG